MPENQIEQLKKLLNEKDQELARYKSEISKLNLQLRELIGQISQEIKMAQVIQKTLVPTEIPNIPGIDFSTKYSASMISGGDYFDIFEHDDKFRFGIVLSSSSGYSLSALFLSVLMRLARQLEAKKTKNPAQALTDIATELLPNLQPEDRADVFYGVVDRRTFDFVYSYVGDVWAAAINNKKIEVLTHQGREALYKNGQNKIEDQTFNLQPKDKVVLCSRGLFQAMNSNGEAFGVKRLEDLIHAKKSASVHDLRNEILFAVEKFTQLSEPMRDQTVLVFEVQERILKLARN